MAGDDLNAQGDKTFIGLPWFRTDVRFNKRFQCFSVFSNPGLTFKFGAFFVLMDVFGGHVGPLSYIQYVQNCDMTGYVFIVVHDLCLMLLMDLL